MLYQLGNPLSDSKVLERHGIYEPIIASFDELKNKLFDAISQDAGDEAVELVKTGRISDEVLFQALSHGTSLGHASSIEKLLFSVSITYDAYCQLAEVAKKNGHDKLASIIMQARTNKLKSACYIDDKFLINLFELPYYRSDADKIRWQARSVAALILKGNLGALKPSLGSPPAFTDEPSRASATAFLVSDQYIITAGHVICYDRTDKIDAQSVEDFRVVFDFQMESQKKTVQLDQRNMFKIKKVVAYKYSVNEDWALLKLDRMVNYRDPLELDVTAYQSMKGLDQVYLLGHPLGLPKKCTLKGRVSRPCDGSPLFKAVIPSYSGNSGSPVFSEKTRKVIGILQGGSHLVVSISDGQLYRKTIDHLTPKEAKNEITCDTIQKILPTIVSQIK